MITFSLDGLLVGWFVVLVVYLLSAKSYCFTSVTSTSFLAYLVVLLVFYVFLAVEKHLTILLILILCVLFAF